MMADVVLYEKTDDGIALVTLNRPEKRNAVSPELAQALETAVKQSEADPDVRVVILTSSNDTVFCAGADLAAVAEGRGAGISTADGGFAGFVYARRRKPWIAAVRGAALAGGCELCLACDMIVAADDSRFGLPEVQRGLLAGAGGLSRLPRAIPRHIAVEMVATGDPIAASRAYALGLINRICAPGDVLDEALVLARRIASNAPIAVQESFILARDADFMDEQVAREAADAAMQRLRTTEDFREGPRAFVEKRAPVWTGR
jgi:enoyl-CoA hydratase/carnithine racemase